ncbi:phosphodiesterase/alkaline phosphatase D precursor [Zopfia rhizophila CBS 207.26]|uniref:Phosphodiesterase/alkaline phosphatase D n=1 Tax=Zopfia rhizophila CBS 207.26 TaxID=1314779 RepID=A0A6A6ESG5_9PEZI|nr:phosphodiesterase/alkaline phosphatase D precursor [Zopfia rhizophila CBS 207.26]
MTSFPFAAFFFASVVTAGWYRNLNYESPSRRHPSLGIDIPKITKRGLEPRAWDPAKLNFTHGVASGDPYANSVILWTRISPAIENDRSNVTVTGNAPLYNHDTETYIKASPNLVCVEYQVSSDRNFTKIVDKGTAYTTSDIDYTVKIEAKNLQPFTTYHYHFTVCGSSNKSPLGRTKTSPAPDDQVSNIGIAVYSCSNYPNGYFNAYGNAARKDRVDYVIHLGDYLYESGKGTLGKDPRATNPRGEIFTLYDYRARVAQYRTDADLLLSHRKFPWIPVWDDHEVSNNGYRDGSSGLNNTEDSFLKHGRISVDQRKMNAVRAYFEWMPIRQVDMDDNLRIWRNFSMGKLFDLIMLDTRNYDRSITTLGWNNEYIYEIANDAGRTLMGSHQENWFYNQLSKSTSRGAVWRIVGNQIIFSRINNTARSSDWFNGDQWDGYQANRNRTFHHLYKNNIGNNIFLAGDSHANWVSDLVWLDNSPYDPKTGTGSIGVEFAGTAVSSTGFGGTINSANTKSRGLVKDNVELQWSEGYYRGYYELHISPDELTANYYGCPTVATRNPFEISLANFTVTSGDNHIARSVANGTVESGALQRGNVKQTNLTLNTETGTWNVTRFEQMFIQY